MLNSAKQLFALNVCQSAAWKKLQQTVELLQKKLRHHHLINDFSQEANQLILAYTKIWGLLLAFDKGALKLLK